MKAKFLASLYVWKVEVKWKHIVANDLKNDEISFRRLGYENHFAEIKKG